MPAPHRPRQRCIDQEILSSSICQFSFRRALREAVSFSVRRLLEKRRSCRPEVQNGGMTVRHTDAVSRRQAQFVRGA